MDGFGCVLEVVHPMESKEADSNIILINIIELSLNIFPVELKLREMLVFVLSWFDHIFRDIIANDFLNLDPIIYKSFS